MNTLAVNWKTSAAGVLALLTVAYKFWQTKTLSPDDIFGVLVAFGLVAAKDNDVVGGTRQQ